MFIPRITPIHFAATTQGPALRRYPMDFEITSDFAFEVLSCLNDYGITDQIEQALLGYKPYLTEETNRKRFILTVDQMPVRGDHGVSPYTDSIFIEMVGSWDPKNPESNASREAILKTAEAIQTAALNKAKELRNRPTRKG